jgi:protein-S-isoprenylcysteine O-methyltransferase Ste14
MSEDRSSRNRDFQIIVRWAVRETAGLVFMGAVLFLAAGRMDWGWAWALVLLMAAWVVGTGAVVIPRHPQLLAERAGPKADAKKWDVVLMGAVGILTLAMYVAAGLDARNQWTADMPAAVRLLALILAGAGYAVTVWAAASNPFFSQVVRIQTERGHRVATGGPYRLLRHPSNLGQIVVYLAAPVVLGSVRAFPEGIACAALILVRTALEDRTLREELSGYGEYARAVRYRLVPGVW